MNSETYREMRKLEEKARAEVGFIDWMDARMEGSFSRELTEAMVRNSIRLGDLVNTDVLVNRHELQKEGIDPNEVRVFLFNSYHTARAIPDYHLVILNSEALGGSNQELYVLLAHELTHIKQLLSGQLTWEQARAQSEQAEYHMDRPAEQEAAFWETQQGTKFGWSRKEFDKYYTHLYPPEAARQDPRFAIEKQLRRQAAMPVLTRHPVAVRRHWRRR